MTSKVKKLKLLLWKNFLIQRRHLMQTVFEIILPIIFASCLLVVRVMVDVEYHKEDRRYLPMPLDNLNVIRENEGKLHLNIHWELPYSPKNPTLELLLNDAIKILNATSFLKPIGYDNATEMEKALHSYNAFCAVEFPDDFNDINDIPQNLTFALRFPAELRFRLPTIPVEWGNWFTNIRFPFFPEFGPRHPNETDGGTPVGYYREGFLPMQAAISVAMIDHFNTDKIPVLPVYARRYPYPGYIRDRLLGSLVLALPLIIVISLLSSVINFTKQVGLEKELQLKEAMKIMGLENWLHWTAWFTKSFFSLTITISMLTLLLKIPVGADYAAILSRTHWSIIWMFLLSFSIPTIMLCFLVSTFFQRANTAAMVSALGWIALFVPFTVFMTSNKDLAYITKLLLCISPNTALGMGLQLIIKFESIGSGLQWRNFAKGLSVDDPFTLCHVVMTFIANGLFYLLLTLYFERVLPGGNGIPEPWYFPLKCIFQRKRKQMDEFNCDSQTTDDIRLGKPGVIVKNLRKVYDTGKVALNNLSMQLYQNQITVLLGHNGAGKSTTMSVLTGILKPSSGTAIINGFDILTDIENVRKSFGLCPQHNILFDDLTVKEHLEFYATLKGLNREQMELETLRYLHKLELGNKKNSLASTLSGGQKRKLSVALALCGNNKVVLLDEPTAGMDPSARRKMWDLLIEEKEGRTILLSTHYMDEADVLGDRIAILSDGELEALGTSFSLKKKYGAGYRLICVKRAGCNSSEVTELLRKHIPDLKIDTEVGAELTYILEENRTDKFRGLFVDLENNIERLNMASFGVSLTTLEDVFMKVGSDSKESHMIERGSSGSLIDQIGRCESTVVLDVESVWQLTGFRLRLNQIKAMFLKKWAYTRRNPFLFFTINFMAMFFVAVAIFSTRGLQNRSDLPSMKMDLSPYEESQTILALHDLIMYFPLAKDFVEEYESLVNRTGPKHTFERISSSFEDEILKISETHLDKMNANYLIGASVEIFQFQPYFTAWFNNQGLHTAPLSVNILYNAILKQFCRNCSINVYNKPLPYKPQTKRNVLYQGNGVGFQLAYNTGFAISFIFGCISVFYYKERGTKSKLLQLVSGVNLLIYWVVSFIWDYLNLLFVMAMYIGMLFVLQEEDWTTWEEIGNLVVIFACCFWGSLPLIYISSFFCDSPTTGFIRTTLFFLFTGNLLYFIVAILAIPGLNTVDWSSYLSSYFVIFPQFATINAVSALDWVITPKSICKSECNKINGCTEENMCSFINECCDFINHYDWEWPGLTNHLVCMIITGCMGWLILILIEWNILEKMRFIFKKRCTPTDLSADVDSDVEHEKMRTLRIKDTDLSKYNLVVKNMSKLYGNFTAVKDLSIAIDASECFGLLGLNGAGKTTTFKMLTGDLRIEYGNAWIQGISLRDDMNKIHQRIGYCPQFDAVLKDLTGYENLRIYCLLRGIPRFQIDRVIERFAYELNFHKHLYKQAKHYSGGNLRKLSAAIALVGNPAVIYLDEPSAGMDIAARRLLWKIIARTREEGKSIVLTSHSMEECEALCTRLAIMVNGEFMCLGSPQLLKSKFSNGFTLKVKVKRQEAMKNLVQRFIMENFNGAVLREEHLDLMTYQIPASNMRWSEMFGIMQKAKLTLDVEDYSLGQTSLEQVFLFFSKYQSTPIEESGTHRKNE